MKADMIIQGLSNVSATYAAMNTSPVQRQTFPSSSANHADRVSVSDAAKAMMASSQPATQEQEIQKRLDAIKAKPAVERTAADTEYLWANDKKLAEISATGKSPDHLTSSELDYMQKAGGFVNTMAYLSSSEKALYDKAVASGNSQASAGLALIALTRTGGHMAGGANGTTYDPIDTAITAANVEKYFSHSIVDPSGDSDAKFQALIQFLQNNPTTS